MVRRMPKKLVLCLLVISLLSSTLVACGSSSTSPANSSSAVSSSTALKDAAATVPLYTQRPDTKGKTAEEILKGDIIYAVDNIKFPISEKPITISILRPYVTDDAEYSKMPVLADYEKKTNIHIDWIAPPSSDFADKYNLLISSGQVPDAIMANPDTVKYGQQGIFLDLSDIIDKNMPNLKKCLDKYPAVKKDITTDDGKIFSLPTIRPETSGNYVMLLRQDWLDKLGLQSPVTTDDWYNVLKAFKNMDPKNITPFSGYGNNPQFIGPRTLISAWGICPEEVYIAVGALQPKDGKAHFAPIEPLFKEGLAWIQKLYKEGLIDPEILTNDDKAFQAKVMQDKVGAWRGYVNGDMYTLNKTAGQNGKTDFKIREAAVIKGPNGDQVHPWKDTLCSINGMVITSKNKYPVETAKWADYWYSEWGRTYVYGIENLTWTLNDKNQPVWTDYVLKNPDGLTSNKVRGSITFGRNTWPEVFQPWSLTASTTESYVEEGRIKYRKADLMQEAYPQGLSFSQEENDTITDLMTDISTYTDESVIQFIIGKKPISEWDAYVKKINDMGIRKVLGFYDEAYKKYQSR